MPPRRAGRSVHWAWFRRSSRGARRRRPGRELGAVGSTARPRPALPASSQRGGDGGGRGEEGEREEGKAGEDARRGGRGGPGADHQPGGGAEGALGRRGGKVSLVLPGAGDEPEPGVGARSHCVRLGDPGAGLVFGARHTDLHPRPQSWRPTACQDGDRAPGGRPARAWLTPSAPPRSAVGKSLAPRRLPPGGVPERPPSTGPSPADRKASWGEPRRRGRPPGERTLQPPPRAQRLCGVRSGLEGARGPEGRRRRVSARAAGEPSAQRRGRTPHVRRNWDAWRDRAREGRAAQKRTRGLPGAPGFQSPHAGTSGRGGSGEDAADFTELPGLVRALEGAERALGLELFKGAEGVSGTSGSSGPLAVGELLLTALPPASSVLPADLPGPTAATDGACERPPGGTCAPALTHIRGLRPLQRPLLPLPRVVSRTVPGHALPGRGTVAKIPSSGRQPERDPGPVLADTSQGAGVTMGGPAGKSLASKDRGHPKALASETLEAELTRPGPVDPYRPPQDLGDTPLATSPGNTNYTPDLTGAKLREEPWGRACLQSEGLPGPWWLIGHFLSTTMAAHGDREIAWMTSVAPPAIWPDGRVAVHRHEHGVRGDTPGRELWGPGLYGLYGHGPHAEGRLVTTQARCSRGECENPPDGGDGPSNGGRVTRGSSLHGCRSEDAQLEAGAFGGRVTFPASILDSGLVRTQGWGEAVLTSSSSLEDGPSCTPAVQGQRGQGPRDKDKPHSRGQPYLLPPQAQAVAPSPLSLKAPALHSSRPHRRPVPPPHCRGPVLRGHPRSTRANGLTVGTAGRAAPR
ncbi:collagen alpha-1(I) chain-like [Mustela lutreola]|uniref:collagen alpha-1(I) chain-like n=1 Tax=Mustela lutreola TaxID=9666 RepID=UPI00279715C0|nr:collagen alpha-1(I) chain-like [Mustela lutreola]